MAPPDDDPREIERRLRAQVRGLEEQLQRLVLTEQRLYYAQRDHGRQLQRVEALNRFAMEWPACRSQEELQRKACETLFSIFSYDQAVGFRCEPDGPLSVAWVHHVAGREAGRRELPQVAGTAADVPAVMTLGALPRSLPPFAAFERIFGAAPTTGAVSLLALPIRDATGDRCRGLLLLRRLGPVGFHESVATEQDRPFLQLFCRHVAAALSQLRLIEDLQRSCLELERAQGEAVRRERLAALGELAAVVAHEVRNPVAVIFNSVSGLRRWLPSGEEPQKLLTVVSEEAGRLDQMVMELIDFARPPAPILRVERMDQIVAEAAERVRRALAELNPTIRIEQEADLPAVLGDARMLHQAVLNLLTNSVQASRPADEVLVRLGREVDAPGVLKVEVVDRGCGIPEQALQRIFEPFFTTKAMGTGLGLAVVKRVVDAHRGTLRVSSRAGEGSAFTLLIPATDGVATRAP